MVRHVNQAIQRSLNVVGVKTLPRELRVPFECERVNLSPPAKPGLTTGVVILAVNLALVMKIQVQDFPAFEYLCDYAVIQGTEETFSPTVNWYEGSGMLTAS